MSFIKFSAESYSNSLRFVRDDFCFDGFAAKFTLLATIIFSFSCQPATRAENDARNKQNEIALLDARKNIEKYRKGKARIKVLHSNGKTIKSAQLKIKQISHDFKFGCYLKIDDLALEKMSGYEKRFSRLFNYAVVGTYWDFIETDQGKENWNWFERETALAEKLELRIQAAPVLWGTNEAGTPDWLPVNKKELARIVEQRVKSIVTKKENPIEDWEIVNEPLAPKTDIFARRIGDDYIESAFRWARVAAPAKRLLINEYGIFGSVRAHNRNRDAYFDLLKDLLKKDVPIDVIGIQAHANGEWYEPANVAEQLNRYAAFGKPIQITEFSAQTFEYDDRKTPLDISGTYRSGIWDAEKQAEFYREFYTISFGNPQVEAIVAWGLDDERAWLPGIGLIDRNETEKPSYKTLDRLINDEWRTNLQIDKAANGTADFRGFYGVYEIEAVINDKIVKAVFALKKVVENEWIIKI